MKLEKSHFTETLARTNALRFNKWVFEPGMSFKSKLKWWGDKGDREEGHNGLDLLFYETDDMRLKTIGGDAKVPIIYEGRVVRCLEDFLGHSLFAAHEIYKDGARLYTIYGHVVQAPGIPIGDMVKQGTVIASLPKTSGLKVPAHIHISVALIPMTIPVETFSWKLLDETAEVHFFDPINII